MAKFGTAFVLTLHRRHDRMAQFRSVAPDSFDYIATDDWPQYHDGVYLRNAPDSDLRQYLEFYPWKIESENRWWNRDLLWGEVGCAVGHWMIWRRAYEMSLPGVYILEDDALFVDEFEQKLSAVHQEIEDKSLACDILYLGRMPQGEDEPISDRLVKPGFSYCSYGYWLSRAAIEKLLALDLLKNVMPLDDFLGAMYAEHPREDVKKAFPPTLSALAAHPPVVTQRFKNDAGSDTERSPSVT